jgi:type II secretory pathway component GspD/PulD (secretin)
MELESDVAERDQDRREEVATEVRVANTIPAQIVRSRPQLLRVPEYSGMLPSRALDRATSQSTVLGQSGDETAKSIVAQTFPEPIQPGTRLAAKWPFERSQPVNPTTGVTLNIDNADVRTVFEMLARGYQMNILVAPDVEGSVTANVEGLSPDQTLQAIVKMCGLNMQQDEDIIYIYAADQIPNDARQLRVFELDFARAVTLEATIQGLLSPVGNAYPTTLSETDNMQTQESIVVVDIPSVILQVERYLMQADQAPRQVMIEAHVLEVELKDDMVHGVNFAAILGGDLTVGSFGLADNIITRANPTFFAQIDGSDVKALLTVLETTTDSKTLASPRVQVINGQNARIQVGQQLGFTVATVTQTSTIQDVQFLETGVVLTVTPNISRDGRILMQVKPEVSDGVINPDTLLPEEETREVETSVLLDNHQGVIIGGLIQEKDRTVIKKLPWLGDVQYVGKLFQRREAVRSRTEIIVALVPHIIERCVQDERSAIDYERAATPLLQGALHRNCRPWDARLPDVVGDDCIKEPIRINHILPDVKH